MNRLAKETSPYLLQHKNNPVDWFPWGEEAFEKAKSENKLVLVSVGYSSCHWCHVMEHEVFEDPEAADFMNQNFVCIKVDREERPDVDHLYMDAVHLMGQRGGWPLNAFCLPDSRPVYGGTYFPKTNWLNILENLVHLYDTEPGKMIDYAVQLQEGITHLQIVPTGEKQFNLTSDFLDQKIESWMKYWDWENGGARKAPKFPMPNNIDFLLAYSQIESKKAFGIKAREFAFITLNKMALGGIYDQIGGGFSRYSVDDIWKVPHFEKMLYDNAQLLSVYSKAFKISANPLYFQTINDTISFLNSELKTEENLYCSALDADSEGVEGKYYIWSEHDFEMAAGDLFEFGKEYFNLNGEGYWEHEQYILLRKEDDLEFAARKLMRSEEMEDKRKSLISRLMEFRSHRVKPGLDDKCLTSWNALAISGLVDSYSATRKEEYLQNAVDCANAIWNYLRNPEGELMRSRTKMTTAIPAFLDDYALLIESYISLFSTTTDFIWLKRAQELTEKAVSLFYDKKSGLFWLDPANDPNLFARKMDWSDNVIPSSNSVMCSVLFKLSHLLGNDTFKETGENMLSAIVPLIDFASGYSNWLNSYLLNLHAYYEVVITGPESKEFLNAMQKEYLPNAVLAASTIESEFNLFKGRCGMVTAIYVCTGRSCFAPVFSVQDALDLIKS
jgi:uncharacterized protein